MPASTCEEVVEILDELDALADRMCELTFDTQTTPELLRARESLQRIVRKLRVPGHGIVNQLAIQASCAELGGSLATALADRLRITRDDANRCIAEATDLGPRRALTGQPLPPVLPQTAAAERRGLIDSGHVRIIRKFFAKLPDAVNAASRAQAEADLALCATGYRPDELAEYARVLKDCLKPDGDFRDTLEPDKTLALYHGKRLASPEQRLVLLARDRGCTRPGCTVPGYWTQVHHVRGWLATHRTDIDELTLACGPDNRMVELHNYTTRRNLHGVTEWIPPAHLDHGRPRTNCMHHPERRLNPEDDEPE